MRVLAVSEMLARDLLRRRVALALLVGLPLAFYGVTRSSSDDLALTSGGVGLAWSIAGAALFCSLAARDVDQRLVLDGFRPGPSRPLPAAVSAAKWERVVTERHERVR